MADYNIVFFLFIVIKHTFYKRELLTRSEPTFIYVKKKKHHIIFMPTITLNHIYVYKY